MKLLGMALIALLVLSAGCGTKLGHNDHEGNGEAHEMEIVSEAQFVIEMIPHHQEAVDTSRIILERSTDEQLRNLAQRIIDAQEAEITMMRSWVAERYVGNAPATYAPMMPALSGLEGDALAHEYLEGMIAHHAMAIAMAEDVLAIGPREDVAAFAQNVIAVQADEIEEMETLLHR